MYKALMMLTVLCCLVSAPISASAAMKSILIVNSNGALSAHQLDVIKSKLESLFNLSVQIHERSMTYGQTYNAGRGKYDSVALLQVNNLFGDAYANHSFLFISEDVYAEPYRYVLAHTSSSFPRTVISTSRLQANIFSKIRGNAYAEDVLLSRIHKIMMRHIAFLSGLKSECGVMKPARSPSELDGIPDTYCSSDSNLLKAYGALK